MRAFLSSNLQYPRQYKVAEQSCSGSTQHKLIWHVTQPLQASRIKVCVCVCVVHATLQAVQPAQRQSLLVCLVLPLLSAGLQPFYPINERLLVIAY